LRHRLRLQLQLRAVAEGAQRSPDGIAAAVLQKKSLREQEARQCEPATGTRCHALRQPLRHRTHDIGSLALAQRDAVTCGLESAQLALAQSAVAVGVRHDKHAA
jgi:hypothetical protein